MNLQQATKQHQQITEQLRKWDELYYGDKPELAPADAAYDALYQDLLALEKQYPQLKTPHSPSQKVATASTKNIDAAKIAHSQPMLSIENIPENKSIAALQQWLNDINSYFEPDKVLYTSELKIDGLAVALRYFQQAEPANCWKFYMGITRGDGNYGEDITKNVRQINNLPLTFTYEHPDPKVKVLELRAEIYFPKNEFQQLNAKLKAQQKTTFQNPRSAAAGSIKIKDTQLFATRKLAIIIYDWTSNYREDSHYKNLQWLKKAGFTISNHLKLCATEKEIIEFYQKIQEVRQQLNMEVDGVVIKVDSINQRQNYGTGTKAPKWSRAWKFQQQQASSQLQHIEFSVSRTGSITPVAVFNPVLLASTKVKRASLFNFKWIEEKLNLHYQDTIIVKKAGEIIPIVTEVDQQRRIPGAKKIEPPQNCPVCNSKLCKNEKLVDIYCPNQKCPARIQGQLIHFCSRMAMDIRTLGPKVILALINAGLVKGIADIYRLAEYKPTLLKLPLFKDKKVNALLEAIENSKSRPLENVIFGLGIDSLGQIATSKLAAYCNQSIENFSKLGPALSIIVEKNKEIKEIDDQKKLKKQLISKLQQQKIKLLNDPPRLQVIDKQIAEINATIANSEELIKQNKEFIIQHDKWPQLTANNKEKISQWLAVEANQKLLQELITIGLTPKQQNFSAEQTKGVVVFSGTLSKPRSHWIKDIQKYGYEVHTSITQQTNYLIVENKNSKSNKIIKAQKLNIMLLDEQEARNSLEQNQQLPAIPS